MHKIQRIACRYDRKRDVYCPKNLDDEIKTKKNSGNSPKPSLLKASVSKNIVSTGITNQSKILFHAVKTSHT